MRRSPVEKATPRRGLTSTPSRNLQGMMEMEWNMVFWRNGMNWGGGDLSGEDRVPVFIEQKCLASAGSGTSRTR